MSQRRAAATRGGSKSAGQQFFLTEGKTHPHQTKRAHMHTHTNVHTWPHVHGNKPSHTRPHGSAHVSGNRIYSSGAGAYLNGRFFNRGWVAPAVIYCHFFCV